MTSKQTIRRSIGSLIGQAGRQWRRSVNRRLDPFDLTEATWLPLLHLARARSPMRQKDLARSLSVDSSSVVRILDSLEEAGLVERKEEETDRRAKILHLTRRGKETVQKVEAVARDVRNEALAGISEEDLATAFRVLRQISAKLDPEESAS